MTTHWSGAYPDGFTSYDAAAGGILIITLVSAVAAVVVHLVERVPPFARRITAGGLGWPRRTFPLADIERHPRGPSNGRGR